MSLIELSYSRNRAPAILVGFSLSSSSSRAAWKDRCAARRHVSNFLTRTIPPLTWIGGDALKTLFESLPVGHDHMPNRWRTTSS
jgi:hypothetical protein